MVEIFDLMRNETEEVVTNTEVIMADLLERSSSNMAELIERANNFSIR